MAPVVLDVYDSDDPQAIIAAAISRLTDGEIVAFPTETVYGIAVKASDPQAIEQLFKAKSRSANKPMTLAIAAGELLEQITEQSDPFMNRLARRCWPGALTMVIKAVEAPLGLSAAVLQLIAPQGWVGLRVPSNEVLLAVLDQLNEPLVLTSANKSDQPDAVTASQVADQLNDCVPLILDGGPAKIGTPSTVIQLIDQHIQILRQGAIDQQQLQQCLQLEIVVVCTGNTCRSPMAEVLLKHKLAQVHNVAIHQLAEKGISVASAGITAKPGFTAAKQAIEVLKNQNLNLGDHRSQPLSYATARSADLILTLSKSHQETIVCQWPEFTNKISVLALDQSDVTDPIGGSYAVYEQCASQIDLLLETRLPEINNLAIPDQGLLRE